MAGPTSKFDVIGLGVSTVDLLMVVDELPAGEAVQRAHESVLQGGGPVATAMVTLARLGAKTAMVDKIGDDWRGRLIVQEFDLEGVSTQFLSVARNRSSSIASVLVRKKDGARTIVYSPGDAGELAPSELRAKIAASAKILHVNGRHLEASVALAEQCREAGVMVSFDGGAYRYKWELDNLIRLSDICIVARQFASAFSGKDGVEASAAKLLESGPSLVVITGGVEGSWIFKRGGESFHQAAFRLDGVVDTTGAGDAYHGAFLFGLLRRYSLKSCALLASAVAAMNTRKLGGRSALPSFNEVVDFLGDRGHSLEK